MQLIFHRRVSRQTPGGFHTQALTKGVTPWLHVEYKGSKIEQYHNEGQALCTKTTINKTYDFKIGRSLSNLPALREIGLSANRRLLYLQILSHDCLIRDDRFQAVINPVLVEGQGAAGLRFGGRRALALLHALCCFWGPVSGFCHRDIRAHVAGLLGVVLRTSGA